MGVQDPETQRAAVKVLVVEDDPDLRDLLKLAVQLAVPADFIETHSAREAVAWLESGKEVQCVICDYHVNAGKGGLVYQAVSARNPVVPFILVSSLHPSKLPEFAGKPIASFIEKDSIVKPLIESMTRLFGSDVDPSTAAMSEVRVSVLRRVNVTPVDLYLRLSGDKIVKVFNREDPIGDEDYERYAKKGVKAFWVKSEDAVDLLSFLSREIVELAEVKSSAPSSDSIESQKDLHETVYQTIQCLGITAETQALIKTHVDLALKSVRAHGELADLLTKLHRKPPDYFSMHSVLLSHVSCWLGSLMTWNSEGTQYKLAMASLLHDMTLSDPRLAPFKSVEEVEASPVVFSRAQLKNFEEHPIRAAELVRTMSDLPADIDQIVAMHHERPDGTGFPLRLSAPKIAPLASLFLVAHDLTDYLLANETHGGLEGFLLAHGPAYQQAHFKRIYQALKNAASASPGMLHKAG